MIAARFPVGNFLSLSRMEFCGRSLRCYERTPCIFVRPIVAASSVSYETKIVSADLIKNTTNIGLISHLSEVENRN